MKTQHLLLGICTLLACGDDAERPEATQNPAPSGGGSTAGGGAGSNVAYAACGGRIVGPDGAIDAAEYEKQARLWDAETIDCRLRPAYEDVDHPGEETPPTAWEPVHVDNPGGYLCKQYELSGMCASGCDYGSTAGQVLFAPDGADVIGVDRAQTYAYENGTICESPQQGGWLGGPSPDPALLQWKEETGLERRLANGFHQAELYETNGGILTFPDGLVGATGNQTAGGSNPTFQFPENKSPSAIALTGYNEFAFVTVWDTESKKGQLAVFALRADSPPAHCVDYFALPNAGGFKNIHLMGYVDLPIATPTSVTALGNNGATPGGKAIGNEFANDADATKHIATSAAARADLARDDYERRVPSAGVAMVASRWENKVVFVDLRPLFQFVRAAYFTDEASFAASSAQDAWPYTFESNPESRPEVVATLDVPSPTAMRIGNMAFADGVAPLHAFVAGTDGQVHLLDITGFWKDGPRPVPASSLKEVESVQAGRNITDMRYTSGNIVVVSRADRMVQLLHVADGHLEVARTVRDSRLVDPVTVDVNDRGPVITIGELETGKMLNYRIGATEDNGNKPPANYGCGPNGADATCETIEFGGELSFPGAVYYIGTTNVN